MRTIKFKGVDRKTGVTVYGDLIQPIGYGEVFPTLKRGSARYHEVKPDSIAQLVGVDTDGDEIYEGQRYRY